MRIPDLVVVFASNHFFRKVFESCSKVGGNSAQESRKSCKIMQNHDFFVNFETISTCTSSMGMHDPCHQSFVITGACTFSWLLYLPLYQHLHPSMHPHKHLYLLPLFLQSHQNMHLCLYPNNHLLTNWHLYPLLHPHPNLFKHPYQLHYSWTYVHSYSNTCF